MWVFGEPLPPCLDPGLRSLGRGLRGTEKEAPLWGSRQRGGAGLGWERGGWGGDEEAWGRGAGLGPCGGCGWFPLVMVPQSETAGLRAVAFVLQVPFFQKPLSRVSIAFLFLFLFQISAPTQAL